MRMNTLIQACNFNFWKAPTVGLAVDGIMLMQMENRFKKNKQKTKTTLNKYEILPYTCTYLIIFYVSSVWTINQVYTTKSSVCATLTRSKHFINTSFFLVLQHTSLLKHTEKQVLHFKFCCNSSICQLRLQMEKYLLIFNILKMQIYFVFWKETILFILLVLL